MCLILLAQGAHPEYPLVIAANRDEYYQRPTAKAAFWKDHPQVLAGRDLECMGTWLGITRSGRFAALTNFRDPSERKTDAPSRGLLVSDFLVSGRDPREYLEDVAARASRYNGFSLLAGDAGCVFYICSRSDAVQPLAPGVHGLSNHLLDTPWPKVVRGRQRLQAALADTPGTEALLELLQDRDAAAESELPDTGIGADLERVLSPSLIVSPQYGTRASTAVLFGRDGSVSFSERTILRGGIAGATVSMHFSISRA